VPRFAIAPLGLKTEGSTEFKPKGWKRYLKKLVWWCLLIHSRVDAYALPNAGYLKGRACTWRLSCKDRRQLHEAWNGMLDEARFISGFRVSLPVYVLLLWVALRIANGKRHTQSSAAPRHRTGWFLVFRTVSLRTSIP